LVTEVFIKEEAMFSLKGVKYKDILDINELHIPGEKITCIIGESGSGKTTLLKLLNNMISCDEGIILFKGQSLYDINPIELRRKVIMLNQNPAIFSGTVKDNLLIGLRFAEKSIPDDSKLINVLHQVYLKKSLEEDAEILSGGEKQRLTLARILLMEPEVLLLDEPSSALDQNTEKEVIEQIIKDVKARQAALIMITHSRLLAEKYGDFIIEVKNGQIFLIRERR
jgi:putative ABC transport system ATP-binding protein